MRPTEIASVDDVDEDGWVTLWTGGAYAEREGYEANPTPEGLLLHAWYDGCDGLVSDVLIPWADLARLREETK